MRKYLIYLKLGNQKLLQTYACMICMPDSSVWDWRFWVYE